MKSTTTMFKRVLIFGALVWGLIQTSRVEAQTPCTGSNAYGCGGRYGYGGDVTDVKEVPVPADAEEEKEPKVPEKANGIVIAMTVIGVFLLVLVVA